MEDIGQLFFDIIFFSRIVSVLCLVQASVGRRRPRRPGFPNSCFRPATPDLYPRSLLINQEGHGRKQGRRTGTRASKIQDVLRSPSVGENLSNSLSSKMFVPNI